MTPSIFDYALSDRINTLSRSAIAFHQLLANFFNLLNRRLITTRCSTFSIFSKTPNPCVFRALKTAHAQSTTLTYVVTGHQINCSWCVQSLKSLSRLLHSKWQNLSANPRISALLPRADDGGHGDGGGGILVAPERRTLEAHSITLIMTGLSSLLQI